MSQKYNFKANTSMDFQKVNIFIESCHNHAVSFLEALNFNMLSTETKMKIEANIIKQIFSQVCRNPKTTYIGKSTFEGFL